MKKKGCLGCSFPVMIFLIVVFVFVILLGLVTGAIGNNAFHLPSWMLVHQPEISLPAETVFHIGSFGVTNTLLAGWITIIFLGLVFGLVGRKSKLVPGRLQGLVEMGMAWVLNLCESVAGEKNGRKFFPLVATIFVYVMMNAWLSLIPIYNSIVVHLKEGEEIVNVPLLRGAGTDANLTLALAIYSFIFVTFYGIKLAGGGFLKTFFNFSNIGKSFKMLGHGDVKGAFSSGVLGIVDAFVGFIELITYFIRLVSFTLRLFGNMTAGEILLGIMMFLIPWIIAVPFYGLELFIGVIQAFVFAGLTLVFAAMAVTPHEGEHAEGHH
jgi:F-type H+-transporting ATPase subunit a